MLKAAIIGLGWWGTTITKSLMGSDKLHIIAGVDVDETKSDFAAEHDLAFYNHLEDALSNSEIEAVIIATPHGLHEEMFLATVEAGKQIFCEKPFALTSAGARRMISAAEAKGLQTIGIGHERRFEGSFEEMKRVVDSGDLGTLLHLEFNASYNNMVKAPAKGWRKDPVQAPAGMMTALGVHQTDFMQTLAGPVAKINAQQINRSDDYPNEDVLTVQFDFESGITGSFTSLATTPFYQRMSIFGDRGWLENREISNVDIPDPAILTWRGMDEEIHTRTYKMTDTVKPNFESWADAVMGNGTYRFSHAEIIHNVQILETIVRSIESGVIEDVK